MNKAKLFSLLLLTTLGANVFGMEGDEFIDRRERNRQIETPGVITFEGLQVVLEQLQQNQLSLDKVEEMLCGCTYKYKHASTYGVQLNNHNIVELLKKLKFHLEQQQDTSSNVNPIERLCSIM